MLLKQTYFGHMNVRRRRWNRWRLKRMIRRRERGVRRKKRF